MEGDTKLYPVVPTEPTAPSQIEATSFRLQKICEVQKVLESEGQCRAALYKKYKRVVNVIDGVDATLITASVAIAATGAAGLLTNIITIPLATVLGVLGVSGKMVGRKLLVKAKKHDEIRVLASAKLNTVSDLVSKALKDGIVSDDEFKLILDELQKYQTLKHGIKSQARKKHESITLDEATKNDLIRQGREQARASLIRKLDGG